MLARRAGAARDGHMTIAPPARRAQCIRRTASRE
jgi:hypothetical protein